MLSGVVIRHSNADKHVLICDDTMLCDVLKWAAAVCFEDILSFLFTLILNFTAGHCSKMTQSPNMEIIVVI